MIEFKPLELENKDLFNKYLDISKYLSSEYNFTTLFAWQEMYDNCYAIVENCFCVKAIDNGVEYFMFPLGEKSDVMRAIIALSRYSKENGRNLKFNSVSIKMIDYIKDFGLEEVFSLSAKRELFDYMYKKEKFINLSGKKLHGKRNHFNYFINNYEYSFVDIDESNEEMCKAKFKEYIFGRSLNPEKEYFATLKVLKYRKELGFVSKCLIVEGNIVGIIMGQKHQGTILIQIAKSDIEYRGAAVALFKFFVEEAFSECEYVNLMEDLGIEGLRKAKLSYDPDFLIEKFLLEKIV